MDDQQHQLDQELDQLIEALKSSSTQASGPSGTGGGQKPLDPLARMAPEDVQTWERVTICADCLNSVWVQLRGQPGQDKRHAPWQVSCRILFQDMINMEAGTRRDPQWCSHQEPTGRARPWLDQTQEPQA